MFGVFAIFVWVFKSDNAGNSISFVIGVAIAAIFARALQQISKVIRAQSYRESSFIYEVCKNKMMAIHIVFLVLFTLAAAISCIFSFYVNIRT